jgi:hypothetical protein
MTKDRLPKLDLKRKMFVGKTKKEEERLFVAVSNGSL